MEERKQHQPSMTIEEQVENLIQRRHLLKISVIIMKVEIYLFMHW